MYQVNIHEAKTNLSKLIEKVLNGDEVIIAKNKKPLVKLVDLKTSGQKRKIGLSEGKILIEKSFDEPLDDFKEYSK